jgi:hypothetical protein
VRFRQVSVIRGPESHQLAIKFHTMNSGIGYTPPGSYGLPIIIFARSFWFQENKKN